MIKSKFGPREEASLGIMGKISNSEASVYSATLSPCRLPHPHSPEPTEKAGVFFAPFTIFKALFLSVLKKKSSTYPGETLLSHIH